MFCPFCGHQNREGKKFCRQCGRTLPPPRSTVGTTPLPHYHTFAEELNLLENPASINSPASLIDQSIYNSFSETIDKSAKVSSPSPTKWQPDIAVKTNEGFAASPEIEKPLDQFTHQLLPDTVGFEVPKSLSSISNNVYSKSTPTNLSSNNANVSSSVSSVSSFSQAKLESLNTSIAKKSSNGSLATPIVDFSDYGDPEFNTTEEMEVLADKGWEKTADIPVLTERTADMPVLTEKTADIPILPERTTSVPTTPKPISSSPSMAPSIAPSILPLANPVKPQVTTSFSKSNEVTIGTIRTISNATPSPAATGVLSITSPTGDLVENTKRIEQIILIIIVLIALIGMGILVWILVLRPLGIAYLPINSFSNLFA
jgi:hypothetical protein